MAASGFDFFPRFEIAKPAGALAATALRRRRRTVHTALVFEPCLPRAVETGSGPQMEPEPLPHLPSLCQPEAFTLNDHTIFQDHLNCSLC